MWPFKKRVVQTMTEYVADKPDVPCKDKEYHYLWTDFEKWGCPACASLGKRRREMEAEDRLADKIAKRIASQQATAKELE